MLSLNIDDIKGRTVPDHQAIWESSSQPSPEVGQLWLLSWNQESLALAVISTVHSGYVRAFPVTPEPPLQREMHTLSFSVASLQGELALWQNAETGLGTFLLDRYLGAGLSVRQIQLLREYVYGGRVAPLPQSANPSSSDGPSVQNQLRLMQAMCFIQWPSLSPGDALLSRRALEDRGIRAQDMAKDIGLSTSTALALWTGKTSLTGDLATSLGEKYGAAFEELACIPEGQEVMHLQQPVFKASILRLAELIGSDEKGARNAVREEFALAARATGKEKAITVRISDAIARLSEEYGGSSAS